MAAVSRFSTPEFKTQLDTTLAQIDEAMNEVNLAIQAGIPNAEEQMKQLQDARSRTLQMLNTYFPNGSAPATQ